MTKVNRQVSTKDARKLVNAYLEYKKAETNFKRIKKEICDELANGRYEFDGICNIIKDEYVRTTLDTESIFADHPEIKKDDYQVSTVVTTVTIQNKAEAKESKSWLKR